MSNEIRNFVVVGGGSAGWIAATTLARLLLKTPLGGYKITLIESSDIGIVGVGEATIPSVRDLLGFLNIDEKDFIKETDATYKLGIGFKDWDRIGGFYWHPFGDIGPLVENTSLYLHWLQQSVKGAKLPELQDLAICSVACSENRFAMPDRNHNVKNWLSYAYHFDAGKFADYLKGYGKAKGVNHIIGNIVDSTLDNEGFINEIILEDGRKIKGDFFIDCSGFAALLVEKKLGSKYEDWRQYLPVDSAYAVQSKNTKPMNPYTLSTAREAGWTWRIPLQSRVGNGYVYSSKFIDDDDALKKLLSVIDNDTINEPRKINFIPGRRKETWVKNCLSLGLASGFLEPLESTAIHLVIAGMFKFFEAFPRNFDFEVLRNNYNSRFATDMEEIRDFLILHYCVSKRDDTEFWRYMTRMEIPDSLTDKIEIFKNQGKIFSNLVELFRPGSWISVLVGMGLMPRNTLPIIDPIPDDFTQRIINDVANAIRQEVSRMPDHETFLKNIINK